MKSGCGYLVALNMPPVVSNLADGNFLTAFLTAFGSIDTYLTKHLTKETGYMVSVLLWQYIWHLRSTSLLTIAPT